MSEIPLCAYYLEHLADKLSYPMLALHVVLQSTQAGVHLDQNLMHWSLRDIVHIGYAIRTLITVGLVIITIFTCHVNGMSLTV